MENVPEAKREPVQSHSHLHNKFLYQSSHLSRKRHAQIKLQEFSFRTVGVSSSIRTEHLRETSLQRLLSARQVARFLLREYMKVCARGLLQSTAHASLLQLVLKRCSWDSSVSIGTGYRPGVRFPVGTRDFSLFYNIQTKSETHPASYPTGNMSPFIGGRTAGA
jgi:hypothetical protein